MPENERNPAVMDLTDGKMRNLPFTFGCKRTAISVKAITHKTDCTELAIWELPFNRRIGGAWFESDPVRAAVQAERERVLRAVENTVYKFAADGATRCAMEKIRAAIDAPAEEVSDYKRGGDAMLAHLRSCAADWLVDTLTPRDVLLWLDGVRSMPEPPR